MSPARWPRRPREGARLLVVDPAGRVIDGGRADELACWLTPGDLVVVNDAATLPASLHGELVTGSARAAVELRLAEPPAAGRARAVLFGGGDWRTPTELRPAPPRAREGDGLAFGALSAVVERVSEVSPRLVTVRFDRQGADLLAAIYRHGRPVQYAHLLFDLPLEAVQTSYAGRPWAVEMPSAGRPLGGRALAALRTRGIAVASLTHAAGLSATGDEDLDASLPLPERYDVPARTVAAIADTRRRGDRVIAAGTTVVRALEDSHRQHGRLVAGPGRAELVLDRGHRLAVVDGLITGMHAPTESHFRLLEAFADRRQLLEAHDHACAAGYLAHEFGDVALVLRGTIQARHRARPPRPRRIPTSPFSSPTEGYDCPS